MRSSHCKTLHGIISSKILYCGTAVITIYRSLFAFLPLRLSPFSLPFLSSVAWIGHTIVSKEGLEQKLCSHSKSNTLHANYLFCKDTLGLVQVSPNIHFQGENDNDEGTFKPLRIINMIKSLQRNMLVSITRACYDKFSILSHV